MTLMSVGLYNEPAGAFMPSVLYRCETFIVKLGEAPEDKAIVKR